jgi:hypothetical protein
MEKKFRAEKRPDNRGGLFVTKAVAVGLVLSVVLAFATAPAASAKELKVLSDKIVTGLGHVECVGYDARRKVFHASGFGPALKPADKDGKGKIAKLALDGEILDAAFLPAKGRVINKPIGNFIKGNRPWMTDIDSVWVFDLKIKQSKKIALPGAGLVNDAVVIDKTLYVSDNRTNKLFRVEPADFAVVPNKHGYLVAAPDLVKAEIRLIHLGS